MQIGVQAFGFYGASEGQANYTRELIRALAAVDQTNSYILFFNSFRHRAEVCAAVERLLPGSRFRIVCTALPDLPWRPLLDLKEQVLWPRLARRLGVEIFHATSYRPIGGEGIKTVLTIQDLSFFLLRDTLPKRALGYYRALEERLQDVDRVIVPSESTRQGVMRHLGVSEERLAVVPHGVDTMRFSPTPDVARVQAARARLGLIRPYVLYVGALTARKNLTTLIRAYHALRSADAIVEDLVLIGKFADETVRLQRLVETLGLGQQVRLLGFVTAEDLPSVYAGAELFVYPSLFEGFGLPILEAMASGIPVVAANATSIPEVAGDAAWLVEASSEEALVEGIRLGLNDVSWRQAARAKGLRQAARFPWSVTAERTLRVYQQAAGIESDGHPTPTDEVCVNST